MNVKVIFSFKKMNVNMDFDMKLTLGRDENGFDKVTIKTDMYMYIGGQNRTLFSYEINDAGDPIDAFYLVLEENEENIEKLTGSKFDDFYQAGLNAITSKLEEL